MITLRIATIHCHFGRIQEDEVYTVQVKVAPLLHICDDQGVISRRERGVLEEQNLPLSLRVEIWFEVYGLSTIDGIAYLRRSQTVRRVIQGSDRSENGDSSTL